MKRLALLLALAACQPSPPSLGSFGGVDVRFVRADTLLAVSRAMTFVPTLGDSQRLMLGSYPTGRYGPRVQIAPAIRAYAHERNDLASGVLLARLVNFDTIPYPKLNLGPLDTVYVWTAVVNGIPSPVNALFVNSRDGTRLEVGLRFHPGPGFRATQPAARFAWRDDDEKVCIWCVWVEWCLIDPD